MKGKEFHRRLTKLFLVLLAAGLLVWGGQRVALAQSYPADYNQAADSSGWIHTESDGWIHLTSSEPATDQATMGVHMEGADESTASALPEDSSDSTAVSTMQPEGNDEQSSQGD